MDLLLIKIVRASNWDHGFSDTQGQRRAVAATASADLRRRTALRITDPAIRKA